MLPLQKCTYVSQLEYHITYQNNENKSVLEASLVPFIKDILSFYTNDIFGSFVITLSSGDRYYATWTRALDEISPQKVLFVVQNNYSYELN